MLVGEEAVGAADADLRGEAGVEPDEVFAAGEAGEIASQRLHGVLAQVELIHVAGRLQVGSVALAIDGGAEGAGIGGEVLNEVQAVPVQLEDTDGHAGLKGLHELVDLVSRVGGVDKGEFVEEDDGDGAVAGEGGVIGEGVGRQGRRQPSVGGVGVLGKAGEGLRSAVLGYEEVGRLEAKNGTAAAVGYDDVEHDLAGDGLDGGNGVTKCGRLLCRQRQDDQRNQGDQQGRAHARHGRLHRVEP